MYLKILIRWGVVGSMAEQREKKVKKGFPGNGRFSWLLKKVTNCTS